MPQEDLPIDTEKELLPVKTPEQVFAIKFTKLALNDIDGIENSERSFVLKIPLVRLEENGITRNELQEMRKKGVVEVWGGHETLISLRGSYLEYSEKEVEEDWIKQNDPAEMWESLNERFRESHKDKNGYVGVKEILDESLTAYDLRMLRRQKDYANRINFDRYNDRELVVKAV